MVPPCGRSISPCFFSAQKPRARFFAPLRCAQNDSMADECADVRLSSTIEPLTAGGIENGITQQG